MTLALPAGDSAGTPFRTPFRQQTAEDFREIPVREARHGHRSPIVIWEERQKLRGNDVFGFFGWSAAVSAHTVLVGARTGRAANGGEGTVYVFVGNNDHWERRQKFPEADATLRRCFGQAIAISGDTALVGSPCDNENIWIQLSGSAYLYSDGKP